MRSASTKGVAELSTAIPHLEDIFKKVIFQLRFVLLVSKSLPSLNSMLEIECMLYLSY